MKGNTSVPTSNAFISQKSDIIKAELAKYRLLKSQGSLLGHGETKEITSLPHNNNLSTMQSPSGDEASHSSVMALLQLNSSQGMLSVSKNEYQLNPPHKAAAQPSPSNSNPSSRVTRKSFGGVADERDHGRLDHNSTYSSGSASRAFSGSQTPSATNKFPPSKNSFNSVSGKKLHTVGRLTAQEEKQLGHLEDLIDAEIEKDLLSKVYPKTTNNTSRNLRSANAFTRDQREIVAPRRNPSVIEKRTSSAAEVIDPDKKNRSSVQRERTKKSSLPDVPTGYLSEDNTPNKMNRVLNMSRDFKNSTVKKERKTVAASTVEMESGFKKTVLPGNVDEGEGDLKEEIEKWRIFGKMMAESYDDLNRKYTDYLKEKEKDKKIIGALKDQINTLKALLKTSKDENTKLKEMSTSESWSRTEESKDLREQKEMAQLTKDIESIKTESKDTMKMIEKLKLENQNLKMGLEEGQKRKDMTEYYQRLAEVRFKECSALAEEIICLRTDLDRSHSNYLRAQKESSAKKGATDSFYSGKKMKLIGETGSILSNLSSAVKNKNLSEKNVPAWEDDSDIPPSPEEYMPLPSKEEKLNMKG